MHIATCTLTSNSAYSQSRMHRTPMKEKESPDVYEERVWREKCHYDPKPPHQIFIPPMSIKFCLSDAAMFLGEKVPGRGRSTLTKHFEAGLLILDNIPIDAYRDKVASVPINANVDGRRGSGRRVLRIFPLIPEWKATFDIHIFDETITQSILTRHLEQAGKFIGIGRFRPRVGGFLGRFNVESVKWREEEV